MNSRMINMLEAMKSEPYTTYTDFLKDADVGKITHWFSSVTPEDSCKLEKVINLMYELYVRENIDFYPYEEYTRVVSYLSEEYKFATNDFLSLYRQFKKMITED